MKANFFGKIKINKSIIVVIGILLLLLISQIILVKMVYAHKLRDSFAEKIAGAYNLKAGTVKDENRTMDIYLTDFFDNKKFITQFIQSQQDNSGNAQMPTDSQLSDMIWKKIIKNAWVNALAAENNITVDQDEIDQYLEFFGGKDKVVEIAQKELNIPFDQYISLVVEPSILEAKVHDYLLSNYHDVDGVSKIQEAYALLERDNGASWDDVAKQYSDDQTYVDDSLWLKESELTSYYEPIKDLQVGEFSKIVKTPLGYIIWKLEGIDNSGDEPVWQAKAIFVSGKDIEDFFNEYLAKTEIKKMY